MADGNEVWSGVVLTPDEQAALDERKLIGRATRTIGADAEFYEVVVGGGNISPHVDDARLVDPRENTRGER